ncbi:MAG TPA: 16S rRNA (cytosine(967)-C(5))-methyltransferase RsmB [Candidatus Kapabacteria bacterium]|nr:16S rRNA (cytosine(967)-C(5))-methyltransferase RsmB [Candidatus Kapabacteria bacterium]
MEKVTINNEKLGDYKDYSNGNNVTARMIAVKLLNRYDRSDSYIDKLLTNALKNEHLIQQDKALLTEIVNGVIRWRARLDWVLTGFYYGDYQKCLNLVKNAMRIALYQMTFLNRIPTHAAINESVEIVKTIQGEKTAGVVNGVLRNISRNIENIRYPDKNGDDESFYFSVYYSFPRWLVKKWLDRLGKQETINLLNYFNNRPYVPIRVNTLKTLLEEITDIFDTHKVAYRKIKYDDDIILLDSPKYDISQSDIFKNGLITIQDPSASLAAKLANPQPNDLVFDLCAAPGGKSFMLAEMMNNKGKIIAMDKHSSKLRFIKDGAQRLGIDIIETSESDALTFQYTELADIVFIDAPCSGLGTLSKKVDMKWKREPEDIIDLVNLQRQIIDNAVKLVKIRGAIIYSTCTIEPEENSENINYLLSKYPNFELDNADKYISKELCNGAYYSTVPHLHGIDGAFAARLIRKS